MVDDYFGTQLTDPYRWMENRHSAEFLDWANEENEYTRAVLADIPNRLKLLKRIQELDSGGTLVYSVQAESGNVVYLKRGPADNVFKLYLRKGLNAMETMLLDPNVSSVKGKHSSM